MGRSSKRPFQPSISSYFHRLSRGDTDQAQYQAEEVPASSTTKPILPHAIQSSLLNVGMRVRKSVPEGYQTSRKGLGTMTEIAYAPWDGEPVQLPNSGGASPSMYRGLVPYCGIFKVGGYASQPSPSEDDLPPLQMDDEWSLPASSQDSTAVSLSNELPPHALSSPVSKKRQRVDADDEDLDLDSQPVSPRSRPISHTRMPNLDQIRNIAIPRSRRRPIIYDNHEDDPHEREMTDVGDFEDASFLCPADWDKPSNDAAMLGDFCTGGM